MEGFPYPPGTLVLGRGSHELPLRTSCAGHIFETISEPQSVWYGCGFIQAAKCCVCEYVTPAIDADFFAILAMEADIRQCAVAVGEEVERLRRVVLTLEERADGRPKAALRDFG